MTSVNEDGTYTAKVFSNPVRYIQPDGDTNFIDTSIQKNSVIKSMLSGYQYRNGANSFIAEFSEDPTKGIRLTSEEHTIQMGILSAVAHDSKGTVSRAGEVSSSQQNAAGATGDSDGFVYPNAFGEHTEIRYYNTSLGIKEDIILYDNIGVNRFDFEMDVGDLVPHLAEDGAFITFTDTNGEEQYTLQPLYIYDSYTPDDADAQELATPPSEDSAEAAYRHFTTEGFYELKQLNDTHYQVTVVVPQEYLNHPQTVYPVIIDPGINCNNSATNVEDAHVYEYSPTKNTRKSSYLVAGNYNGVNYNDKKAYMYIKFKTLPTLPVKSRVVNSYITLHYTAGQTTSKPLKAQRVISSWSSDTICWQNRPSVGSITQCDVGGSKPQTLHPNITGAVDLWYMQGSGNYGIMFSYHDESQRDVNNFYSSDCGNAELSPALRIDYVSGEGETPGVEDNCLYYIKNKATGQYLDFNNTNNKVVQHPYNGNDTQKWGIVYQKTNDVNGFYKIYNLYNAKCLGVSNTNDMYGFTANPMSLQNDTSSDRIQFRIFSNGDGSFRFMNRAGNNAGKMLSAAGNSSASFANMVQYPFSDSWNQRWVLEKASAGSGGEYRYRGYGVPQCFGYAMFLENDEGVTFYWWETSNKTESYVGKFKAKIEQYASCERIAAYNSPIDSDEYRIAVRAPAGERYRYHVIYQLSNGQWAGKDYLSPSELLGYGNPDHSPHMWANDAYSPEAGTIYFAVRRDGG